MSFYKVRARMGKIRIRYDCEYGSDVTVDDSNAQTHPPPRISFIPFCLDRSYRETVADEMVVEHSVEREIDGKMQAVSVAVAVGPNDGDPYVCIGVGVAVCVM